MMNKQERHIRPSWGAEGKRSGRVISQYTTGYPCHDEHRQAGSFNKILPPRIQSVNGWVIFWGIAGGLLKECWLLPPYDVWQAGWTAFSPSPADLLDSPVFKNHQGVGNNLHVRRIMS